MSLVGWWPLDGDTNDRVNNNDGSGSPTYVDGKLGQGIEGDGATINVPLSESIESAFTGNQMTLSLWWKQDVDGGWADIVEFDSVRLERGNSNDPNTGYWCNLGSGGGDQLYTGDIGVPRGEWFHIVVRRNGDDYEVWINGELDQRETRTADMNIGSDLHFNPQGSGSQIDDIRLYDHAISAKRIKQLSRGKILHYKFNDGENFEYEWYDTSSLYGSNGHPSNESEMDNFFDQSRSDVTLEGNGNHTNNINWGSSGQSTQVGSVGPKPDYLPGDGYSWKVGGTLYAPESGTYTIGVDSDDASDVFIDGQRITEYYGGHGFGGSFDNHSDTVSLDVGFHSFTARMEEGGGGDGISVAWQKPSDSSWSIIPDSNFTYEETITDTSGQGNNGTLNGPTYTTDSALGSGAYDFDRGSNDYIDIPTNKFPTGSEITVSFWSYGGSELPVDTSILEVETSGNDRVANIHHPWGNGNVYWDCGGSNGDDRIYRSASSSDYKGRWAHWAFTKNTSSGEMKIYLDGEEWHSGSGNGKELTAADSGSIGSYADGGSNHWPGKIADFRIYATELSATEITEIYQQRASIDAGGNTHGHEMYETKDKFDEFVGSVRSDTDVLGSTDGFNTVYKVDARENDSYEDFLTGRVRTGDWKNSGPGNYLYLVYWLKGNNAPDWAERVRYPTPSTSEYQQYIFRSDGQNGRDEYFRQFFSNSDSTSYAYIAEPKIYTESDFKKQNSIQSSGTVSSNDMNEVGPAPESLVGWWPLDGNLRDYSGSENDGTNNGASITSGLGQSAYSFSGDTINVGNHQRTEPFTISAWLQSSTIESGDNNGAVGNADYLNGGFFLAQNVPNFGFVVNSSSSQSTAYGSTDISNNTWHHVVGVFDGSEIRLYVDAVNDATETSSSVATNSNDTIIGTSPQGGWGDWQGKIQDVRIYDRALSDAEVAQLYAMTDPRKNQQLMQTQDGSVLAKESFSELL